MLPDRVSNPGSLTYEPGALPIALHGPAFNGLSCFVYEQLGLGFWSLTIIPPSNSYFTVISF